MSRAPKTPEQRVIEEAERFCTAYDRRAISVTYAIDTSRVLGTGVWQKLDRLCAAVAEMIARRTG